MPGLGTTAGWRMGAPGCGGKRQGRGCCAPRGESQNQLGAEGLLPPGVLTVGPQERLRQGQGRPGENQDHRSLAVLLTGEGRVPLAKSTAGFTARGLAALSTGAW